MQQEVAVLVLQYLNRFAIVLGTQFQTPLLVLLFIYQLWPVFNGL